MNRSDEAHIGEYTDSNKEEHTKIMTSTVKHKQLKS